jgi:hypothetical protein
MHHLILPLISCLLASASASAALFRSISAVTDSSRFLAASSSQTVQTGDNSHQVSAHALGRLAWGGELTGLVALGVVLQFVDEFVEIFLFFLPSLETAALEFWIVSLSEGGRRISGLVLVHGWGTYTADRCGLRRGDRTWRQSVGWTHHEQLFFGRCHVVDECWTSNAHDATAGRLTFLISTMVCCRMGSRFTYAAAILTHVTVLMVARRKPRAKCEDG